MLEPIAKSIEGFVAKRLLHHNSRSNLEERRTYSYLNIDTPTTEALVRTAPLN